MGIIDGRRRVIYKSRGIMDGGGQQSIILWELLMRRVIYNYMGIIDGRKRVIYNSTGIIDEESYL